eukprot:scaffold42933_cov46-Attheya_sp.AAC.1
MFRDEPKLRGMGLFGCTHKTVAIGVPLINAMYEDNPNVGLYTLPLIIWHAMQLVILSFLAPRLAAFVERKDAALLLAATREEATSELPASKQHDEETPPLAGTKQ